MLNNYLIQVRRLLQNPSAPTQLYADADLTSYINTARGQIAGEGECIRYIGSVATVIGQQVYNFSDINTGTSSDNGIEGAINVQQIWYVLGTGQKWIPFQPWPWFSLYYLNNPVPEQSYPTQWSQYSQGSAPGSIGTVNGGSFYINPPPDMVYTLNCDCACYPIPLVDDTTVEAIPYLWTDAVPWYAAAYALWSSQTGARTADAERYFNTYTEFMKRARAAANPSLGRWQYNQAGDPVQASKLQIQAGRGGV